MNFQKSIRVVGLLVMLVSLTVASTRVLIFNLHPVGAAQTSQSKEIHVRTRAPTALRIPEFDASDSAAVTRKINLPRPSPARDSVADLNIMVGAVLEVHKHALKLDGSASNL